MEAYLHLDFLGLHHVGEALIRDNTGYNETIGACDMVGQGPRCRTNRIQRSSGRFDPKVHISLSSLGFLSGVCELGACVILFVPVTRKVQFLLCGRSDLLSAFCLYRIHSRNAKFAKVRIMPLVHRDVQ